MYGMCLRCYEPDEGIKRFVRFICREYESADDDYDGVLLVFAHQENLASFLRSVILADSRNLKEDLACVKGYLILEVRYNFVHSI